MEGSVGCFSAEESKAFSDSIPSSLFSVNRNATWKTVSILLAVYGVFFAGFFLGHCSNYSTIRRRIFPSKRIPLSVRKRLAIKPAGVAA
jgi:hypothetical protein